MIPFHTWLVFAVTLGLAAWGFHAALFRPGDRRTPVFAAAAILLAQTSSYWGLTVDDAFITFRYARNWAEGLGPVYQAGDRVEGFTSFAWTGLLALASRAGLDLEGTSRMLGLAAALATLPALASLLRVLRSGSPAAGIAPILLACDPLFASWATAGMEAPLFAAALTWALRAFVADRTGFPLDALLLGLLVWIRPEGLLFAGLAWMLVLVSRDRPDRMRWTLVLLLAVVPFWIGRWAYFGDFFPNTFYAKTGLSRYRLLQGVRSLRDFAVQTGPAMVVAAAFAILRGPWRTPGERLLLGSLLGFFAYVVWAGGDVLHLRFYIHVLPLWVALAAVGIGFALAAIPERPSWVRAALPIAIGTVLAILTFGATRRAFDAHTQFGPAYVVNNGTNIRLAHLPLGRWLGVHAPPGSVVAATDIGGIGYVSALPIVDLYGLTDRRIARLLHRNATALERSAEVRDRNVDFLVLYGTPSGPTLGWLAAGDDWVTRRYRVHSFWPDANAGTGMVLLARNGLALPAVSASPRRVSPMANRGGKLTP